MSSTQPSYDCQWANAPPGFSCACNVQGPGIARVIVSGELDMASAPRLDDALSEAARGSVAVIVDLSELDVDGLERAACDLDRPRAACRSGLPSWAPQRVPPGTADLRAHGRR